MSYIYILYNDINDICATEKGHLALRFLLSEAVRRPRGTTNTGKDGSFQLALPPERHLGWLPRPPGREEPKVRPRYSERRSVSGGRPGP